MIRNALVVLLLPLALVYAAPEEEKPDPAAELEARKKLVREKVTYRHTEFECKVQPAVKTKEGIFEEKLSFPSPKVSSHPDPNDTVHAVLYRTEKPRPAGVIALEGWGGEPITGMLARRLAKETGIQVLVVEIPFQGKRTPKGKRSGELTFSADLDRNFAVFVQLAQDVARARHWLVHERKIEKERLGIVGTSLGGFLAATIFGLDDSWAAGVCQLTGGDIADTIYGGHHVTALIRADLEKSGLAKASVRRQLRTVNPVTWAKPERKDALLLIGAEDDTVVTPKNVMQLAIAYGGATVIFMEDENHFAFAGLQKKFPELRDHMKERLLPKPEKPPAKDFTPPEERPDKEM